MYFDSSPDQQAYRPPCILCSNTGRAMPEMRPKP
jgi:hypothetical protein